MNKSNLYIEKIYGDHPIACWAMDDNTSYRQHLSQNPNSWIGPIEYWEEIDKAPPIEGAMTMALYTVSPSVDLYTTFSFPAPDIDPDVIDMTFSAWVYHPSTIVTSYEIGYIDHFDETEYFSTFSPVHKGWNHIFHTFDTADISPLCEVYIRIYSDGPEIVFLNAPSLGQNSEEYCSYSIGYVAATGQPTLTVDEYGSSVENNGVYNLNEYSLPYVREGAVPMVFGSSKTLILKPNEFGEGCPIQFPGSGFLHENGKNKNYTFEFWTRFINYSQEPVRIFGAIGSTDGIYLEENFISVYIGPYTQSYFMGKQYRPMLIHFEYSPTNVYLFVNGERVISMDIDVSKIPFSTGDDQIGFFASSLVNPMEIDAVALYPYTMPSEMAKRHFVYGQGVQDFDFSNGKFMRKRVEIDFPFAEYAYNVIYPDTMKWRSGYSENLETSSTYVRPSVFDLPEVIAQKNDEFVSTEEWLQDNYTVNFNNTDIVPYVTMLPNGSYSNASIYFKTLKIFNTKSKAAFGIFRSPVTPSSNQEVLSFVHKQNGESLKAILNGTTLGYYFYDSTGTQVGGALHTDTIPANSYFYAGVDFDVLSTLEYETVGIFFSDKDKISLSIGGTEGNVFKGRVFRFNFIDDNSYENDMGSIYLNGFISQDSYSASLVYRIYTYSMNVINSNTSLALDVGTKGRWEDSLPLSMFGKSVSSPSGKMYDLDTIQFNIDAQFRADPDSENTVPYSAFEAILNNLFDTYGDIEAYYSTYNDLYQQVLAIYDPIRGDVGIKTYVTLQHFSDIGTKPYSDYVNTTAAPDNNVIEFNMATISNTKYEIFDNYVIVIPKTIDFNDYYLTIYMDISVKGSHRKNFSIKRCELSSFVFNDGTATKIGTKGSIPIYPFAEAL